MTRVITFGTFDLFHIGHLNMLKRANDFGDYLIVGVSTDQLNYDKKKKYPIYNQNDRKEIVKAVRYVDDVFYEESLELKRHYIEKYSADILVMGDDWEGKFDFCSDLCKIIYLPRTKGISTSDLKITIRQK